MQPGIIDARARYRAVARWLRNTVVQSFGTRCVHCLCIVIQLYAGEVSLHCCTSRSWLYTVLPSGLVVLQHNRVVRMPKVFTDEHPDMRFMSFL